MSRAQPHCGCCSRCIDRRFSVLAAGAEDHDPAEAYRVDLLTGPRDDALDRTLAESHVRTALEMRDMHEIGFFSRFAGETARVLDCFPSLSADEVGKRVLDLHRRHGDAIRNVLAAAVARHSSDFIDKRLPPSSVLAMAVSQGGTAALNYFPAERDYARDETEDYTVPALPEALETRSVLQLTVDPDTAETVVPGLTRFSAADSAFIQVLLRYFREDREAERAPKNFRYVQSKTLCGKLRIGEPTLRRRVKRCRSHFGEAYQAIIGYRPKADALIQNRPHRGYRLNPVAFEEIERGTRMSRNH